MNYPDANHLLGEKDRKEIVFGIEWITFRTLPNSEVSILVKIIVAYFRNGNYGKCDVLSGALSRIMHVLEVKGLMTSCRNVWFIGFSLKTNTALN